LNREITRVIQWNKHDSAMLMKVRAGVKRGGWREQRTQRKVSAE